MNLNYEYNKQALQALADSANKHFSTHNLVIDFDGEVVVDPEIHFANVPLNRYQFCTVIDDKCLRDEVALASFYDALDNIFTTLRHNIKPDIKGNNNFMSIAA